MLVYQRVPVNIPTFFLVGFAVSNMTHPRSHPPGMILPKLQERVPKSNLILTGLG